MNDSQNQEFSQNNKNIYPNSNTIYKTNNLITYQSEEPKKSHFRLVYECYKPNNLEEAHSFTEFMLTYRSIIANEIGELDPDNSLENEVTEKIKYDFDPECPIPEYFNSSLRNYFEIYASRVKGIFQIFIKNG